MNAPAFLVLTLLFELQNVVSSSDHGTNYITERTTTPTNEYNPLENLLLNQNGSKQMDGPIVKETVIEQITNPPKRVQSSTESNIEKIPPNKLINLITDLMSNVKESESDSSSKASVRVKRQYFPYPVPFPYRRPYYPIPIIVGGGGFPLRGFGRGYGGRGYGGRGYGGRGYGGRGYGARGLGARGLGGRGLGGRGLGGRGFGGRGIGGFGGRGGFGGGHGGRG